VAEVEEEAEAAEIATWVEEIAWMGKVDQDEDDWVVKMMIAGDEVVGDGNISI